MYLSFPGPYPGRPRCRGPRQFRRSGVRADPQAFRAEPRPAGRQPLAPGRAARTRGRRQVHHRQLPRSPGRTRQREWFVEVVR